MEPSVVEKFVKNLQRRPYSKGRVTVKGNKTLKVRSGVVYQKPYAMFRGRSPCNATKIELEDILFRINKDKKQLQRT